MVKITKKVLAIESERTSIRDGGVEFGKMLDILKEEQPEIIGAILLGGVLNQEMLRGFLAAYFAIRTELQKDELAQLEKIGGLKDARPEV